MLPRVSKCDAEEGSRSQIWEFWLKKVMVRLFFTRFLFFFKRKNRADFQKYFLGEFVATCNDTGTSTAIFGTFSY